uniref:Uncharacterized protein n=1 Tax=Rhizophora mucronata TaxID=61149 RepID=A0A2P2QSU9_RHIMU
MTRILDVWKKIKILECLFLFRLVADAGSLKF